MTAEPPLSADVRRIVEALALRPHPEGGFYAETFRAPLALGGLPHGAPRAASTAIYFLLPAGTFSAWHVVASDEAWHHYDGGALLLHTLDATGALTTTRLGKDLAGGERPQHVVPAGSLQAAEPTGAYALCGCTVAPGFDFADFRIPSRAELLARGDLPQGAAALVRKLTRD